MQPYFFHDTYFVLLTLKESTSVLPVGTLEASLLDQESGESLGKKVKLSVSNSVTGIEFSYSPPDSSWKDIKEISFVWGRSSYNLFLERGTATERISIGNVTIQEGEI